LVSLKRNRIGGSGKWGTLQMVIYIDFGHQTISRRNVTSANDAIEQD